MALFQARFFSEILGIQTEAIVILPQKAGERQIGVQTVNQSRERWPCLWLLHGLSDDHSIWTRRTAIERYAEAAGIAVVMPNAHRSFYTNMAHGPAYWDFLSEELPAQMREFFPLDAHPDNNAVAGLSMGGYGAFKWALRKPECFRAAASLSGVMDISARFQQAMTREADTLRQDTLRWIFGEIDPGGGPEDLFTLAESLGASAPSLLQICGTEDELISENRRFREHAEHCGVPLTYRECPGSHEWGLWDREIQSVLAWLPSQGFAVEP